MMQEPQTVETNNMPIHEDLINTSDFTIKYCDNHTFENLKAVAKRIGRYGAKEYDKRIPSHNTPKNLIRSADYIRYKEIIVRWETTNNPLRGKNIVKHLEIIEKNARSSKYRWIKIISIAAGVAVLAYLGARTINSNPIKNKSSDQNSSIIQNHTETTTPIATLMPTSIPTERPRPRATTNPLITEFLKSSSKEATGKRIEVIEGNIVGIDLNGNVQYWDKEENKFVNIPPSPMLDMFGDAKDIAKNFELSTIVVRDGEINAKYHLEAGIYFGPKNDSNFKSDVWNFKENKWQSEIDSKKNIEANLNFVKPTTTKISFLPAQNITVSEVTNGINVSTTDILSNTSSRTVTSLQVQTYDKSSLTEIPAYVKDGSYDKTKAVTGSIDYEVKYDDVSKLSKDKITPLTFEYNGKKYVFPFGFTIDTTLIPYTYTNDTEVKVIKYPRNLVTLWQIAPDFGKKSYTWVPIGTITSVDTEVEKSSRYIVSENDLFAVFDPAFNNKNMTTTSGNWGSSVDMENGTTATWVDSSSGPIYFRTIYNSTETDGSLVLQFYQPNDNTTDKNQKGNLHATIK